MTEPTIDPPVVSTAVDDDKLLPIVVYGLYLLGWLSVGVAPVIGFVMAYALKGRANPMARSHYVFQIRTGWISLIALLVAGIIALLGLPLLIILVGFVLLYVAGAMVCLIGVWVSVRSVVGLIYASRGDPYPRPTAWLI